MQEKSTQQQIFIKILVLGTCTVPTCTVLGARNTKRNKDGLVPPEAII